MKTIRRILFVRTDRMGDVLMNLPALHLLRQSFPEAWICLLADEALSGLFRACVDWDEMMAVNAARIRSSLRCRFECLGRIKKGRFDMAIVSNADKHFHALVFLAGIPVRVGYRRKWPFLLTRTIPDDKARAQRHEMESNLNLVRLVSDKAWDGRFVFEPDPKSVETMRARLSYEAGAERRAVILHAGTSNPAKRWGVDGFVAVCDWLVSEDLLPILIGGEEEREWSGEVARKAKARVLDWTGSLALKELTALFHDRRVGALVSSDSGPVHVAWMSGTPVVALYARGVPGSDPARWGPRDGRSEVIYKPMGEISAREVCEKIEEVLRRNEAFPRR